MPDKKGYLIAGDTESGFNQYLHKVMSRIEKDREGFCIDLGWLDRVRAT